MLHLDPSLPELGIKPAVACFKPQGSLGLSPAAFHQDHGEVAVLFSHGVGSKLCILPGSEAQVSLQCLLEPQETFGWWTSIYTRGYPKLLSSPRNSKANAEQRQKLFGFCFLALSLALWVGSLSYASYYWKSPKRHWFFPMWSESPGVSVLPLYILGFGFRGTSGSLCGGGDRALVLDQGVLALNCYSEFTWH